MTEEITRRYWPLKMVSRMTGIPRQILYQEAKKLGIGEVNRHKMVFSNKEVKRLTHLSTKTIVDKL